MPVMLGRCATEPLMLLYHALAGAATALSAQQGCAIQGNRVLDNDNRDSYIQSVVCVLYRVDTLRACLP